LILDHTVSVCKLLEKMSQPISDVYEKDSEKTTPRRDEGEGGKRDPRSEHRVAS